MLTEVCIMSIGLLVSVAVVQWWGLRLSGVMVVPLLAIYGLYNYATIPVFILSTIAAYISLHFVKQRTLLYGRGLLLAGILIGALVPLLTLVVVAYVYGVLFITEIEFVGTILPGIAAYNFHQLSLERRLDDAILSLGVLTGLLILGTVLLEPLAGLRTGVDLPPILLSEESDVAAAQGLAVDDPGYQGVVPITLGGAVIGLGLFLAEAVRSRWGLRAGGIIAIPLLAVFSLQDAGAVVLYLLVLPIVYGAIAKLEGQTLLYGRIILSVSLMASLAVALPFVAILGMEIGLIAFFSAIFAGISVYNFRRVPPIDRFQTVLVTAGVFAISIAFLRVFVEPAPGGLFQLLGIAHLVGGALLLTAAVWACYQIERKQPDLNQLNVT